MAEASRTVAGRYELTMPISRGGMGEVWRGYDTVLDRDVAVKLIRPGIVDTDEQREELIGRFRREARVTARVEHPGVPAVYDAAFDAEADRLFLVMQLVHGVSLADVLAERGALPVEWAVSIAAQVCAVLSYAHAVPIVHRDLKPGNVMIANDGSVKVLDFGVAAVLRSGVARLTSTGSIIGTKPYMSPEQIQNAPITPRSDLYALGCLLHELLCGTRVFTAEDEVALMFQHVDEAPEPLRKLVPDVPVPLERLVLDLLGKHPADRPESAASVHERLVPFLPVVDQTGVDDEPPPGGIPDPTRPYRRPIAPRPRPRPVPEPGTAAPGPDRDDIERALDAAAALVDEDRFTQAISLLTELIQPAVARFGRDATLVLDLRTSYAAALYLDGAFRQALPQFDALAASFERLAGPNAEQTLEYRRQAIECRVALGDTVDVLPEVESVLRGYQRLGHDNTREVLDLRLTIVRLRLGVGQRDEAGTELRDLYRDARRALGPDDELTDVIREMAARLGTDTKDHR